MSFKTSADYDQLEWYANGPAENYSGRNNGARLCQFNNTVHDNVPGYVIPQACGNRTGVRCVTVTGKQMGVGDDSWGAPVYEQYRIKAEDDYTFSFIISYHNSAHPGALCV